ncbi:response regulator [bacterium]|nr:response regulator [bacterium]RQV99160.1 MAG: response regulator [bacterium]
MLHVLLVDDDHNFRRSLLIQLEFEGFHVTEVQSGDEALMYLDKHFQLQKGMPDLVISDMKMDGLNGTQLFSKIQQNYPSLPVILISAFELQGEANGCPFLKKPFNMQQMLSVMNQSLQNHWV